MFQTKTAISSFLLCIESQTSQLSIRDAQILVRFFEKKSDSVQNEFGSVKKNAIPVWVL